MSDTWPSKPLAEVANFHSGFAFPEVFQGQQEGELPFFKVSDMSREGNERYLCTANNYVSAQLAGKLNWKPAPAGGIAFAKVGAALLLNRRRELGQDSLFDNNILAVSTKGYISNQWLYWQLLTVDFADFVQVGALPSINQQQLGVLPIPVPALAEQQKIAQILDTLDTQIRQTEALIAKLERIKQGLLTDLLTRGIDQNGHLRPAPDQAPHLYKESPLGRIPREWEVVRLGAACAEVVDCPHSTPEYLSAGVLVARTMHIKNGEFLVNEASRVSESSYRERIARLEPQPGDVIFTREAPVGEAFVIPAGMRICLGQRVMLLRPEYGRMTGSYLVSQIYSGAVASRIQALTSGTTNPHLNVAEVKEFLIPLPPIEEQQIVDAQVSSLRYRLRIEHAELAKLSSSKNGLMDDLLTGRIRVTPLLNTTEQAYG